MGFLRRKHLVRKLAVAAVVLAAVAGGLWYGRAQERYVPGEGAAGLVDTLARNVPADHPALRFEDVTESAGLRMRHFPGRRTNRLPEDMGSGVALGDVDGDGWVDVFVVNERGPLGDADAHGRCALFRNRGDGTFEDVSASSGADLERMGMAAAFLDVDSDGDLDLLVTSYDRLDLLLNDGAGRFTDATAAAGLDGLRGFWTGVAVGDYDGDGAVDAYVCGYVRYDERSVAGAGAESQYGVDIPVRINPSAFEPERNLLLKGRGDGTFEERAERAGVANPTGRSLGAVFADLSGDGLVDLYVANDVSDNAFFVNRGDGTFEDLTTAALVGDYRGAMGLTVGDWDGDLDPDFFVTHWVAQENALYENMSASDPEGRERPVLFMDVADRVGLGQVALEMVGWATRLVDLDGDGLRDLFVVNGSTIPLRDEPEKLTPMRSHLYWNAGPGRGFYEIGAVAGDFFREQHVGRGGATFDYDLDGDEDLVVMLHGEGPRLLRNDGGNAKRSIRLRLRQPSGNRFALGARVRLEAGGRGSVDQVGTQGSYLSQHAVGELSFGLGEAASVDRLVVTWPDGGTEEAGPLPADSLVTWVRGSTPEIEALPGKRGATLAGPTDAGSQREFYRLIDEASRLRLAGDCEGAIASYERALEAWPAHEDALYYRGNCLVELGRREEALEAFETLVRFHPSSSKGWMQIGSLHLSRQGRSDEDLAAAERAFARCHEINGEESLPVIQLGVVAMLRGDLERADRLLADAAVLNPKAVQPPYFRGRIAWLRGDAARAGELLNEAHAAARGQSGPRASVSNEGDTRAGKALVAEAAAAGDPIERWRTLSQRSADPALEYGQY